MSNFLTLFWLIFRVAGLPDLHKFSKQEARHFFLNGTPETTLDGVKFELGGGLYDTPSGLSCYVHYPKQSFSKGGTLRPRMTESPMYRRRTVAMWYTRPSGVGPEDICQIMNFTTGEWEDAKLTTAAEKAALEAYETAMDAASDAAEQATARRTYRTDLAAAQSGRTDKVKFVTLMMSSAIIGRGGSSTGELIVAYPLTYV